MASDNRSIEPNHLDQRFQEDEDRAAERSEYVGNRYQEMFEETQTVQDVLSDLTAEEWDIFTMKLCRLRTANTALRTTIMNEMYGVIQPKLIAMAEREWDNDNLQ